MDPRIGMLNRDGKSVFYAFPHGYDRPAVEGSLRTVERSLGIRAIMPRKPRVKRSYVVTLMWHGAAWEEITVEAFDATDAIRQGREWKNYEYGRTRSCGTLACQFRARLVRNDD